MSQTLIRNIGLLASAIGQNERVIAEAAASANSLAVVAGNAAAAVNSRFDALSEADTSFISVAGTSKPVTESLTGLESANASLNAVTGTAFTWNTSEKRIVVTRDCLATIIGFGDARPATSGETGDANANFRLLIRRKAEGDAGNGEILVDCRQFIKLVNHTGSLSIPITARLVAGDRINVETCCYGTSRGNSNITVTLVEHPNVLALDSQAADRFAQITTQLAGIEDRVSDIDGRLLGIEGLLTEDPSDPDPVEPPDPAPVEPPSDLGG